MPSRVVKSKRVDHVVTIRGDRGVGTVILVKGRRRAYLWVGDEGDDCAQLVCGPKTLRALAEAILKEVPE